MARKRTGMVDLEVSDEQGQAAPKRLRKALPMSPSISRATEMSARPRGGPTLLDPDLIEDSFGPGDRMGGDAAKDQDLVDSIREHGQMVPGLVRPHPDAPGRYQVVYGRRRLSAVKSLQQEIPDIRFLCGVKSLNDADFIIFKGQENTNRRDLSYLERCRFASAIVQSGYTHDVAASALNVDRTTVTKMMSLVQAIDEKLLDAIGPAPDIGRPRWTRLAQTLENLPDTAQLADLAQQHDRPSSERFAIVLEAATKMAQSTSDEPGDEGAGQGSADSRGLLVGGRSVGQVSTTNREIVVRMTRTKDIAAFTNWIDEHLESILQELHDRFAKDRREESKEIETVKGGTTRK